MTTHRLLVLGLYLLLLQGCATLRLEPPHIAVVNIKPVAGNGLGLAFDVQLKVVNPNGVALPIKGMSYQLALNGIEVLQGATAEIPSIPAYGERQFSVPVSASLLAAPKLLLQLANQSAPTLDYEFSARIDLQGFLPSQYVVEKGRLE